VVSLRDVDDANWRAVADVAPRDDQRGFVSPLAARYLLLSSREGVWISLGIYADDEVVGHVMWAIDDDDGSHWIGGLVIDAEEQSTGLGRAATQTIIRWLAEKPDCHVIRLSYGAENQAAERLYAGLGFTPTGERVDDEIVAELRV
jgi:diamine N-acetyltransferase